MKIQTGKPKPYNSHRIMRDYYQYFASTQGPTIFHKKAIEKIENKELEQLGLCMLDRNYWSARCQLEMISNVLSNDFIGMYADNDNIIAHCNVSYVLSKDEKFIAQVGNIFIHRVEEFLVSANRKNIKWLYGIYNAMLDYIENHVNNHLMGIDEIEFMTMQLNDDLVQALEALGYELVTPEKGDKQTCIKYTKRIREMGVIRARSNTNQQTNK